MACLVPLHVAYLRMRLCAMVSAEVQLPGPGTPAVVLTSLCRGRISVSTAYDVSGLDFQHTPVTVLAAAPHAVAKHVADVLLLTGCDPGR